MPTPDAASAREAFHRYAATVKNNFYTDDPHLQSLLRTYWCRGQVNLAAFEAEMRDFGGRCAKDIDTLARISNQTTHLPRLVPYTGFGERIDAISFPNEYHEIGRIAYGTGVMGRFADGGRELEAFSFVYLLGQNGEGGHTCPWACTAGLVRLLKYIEARKGPDALRQSWLTRLTDPNYDTAYRGSQYITEVQGGADVGANQLRAVPDPSPPFPALPHRIYGEKWFCSVIDAQVWLVLARPEGGKAGTGGLQAYLLPRNLPDGKLNHFRVRRLKDKLGTRSMASGEVDFEGAHAMQVCSFVELFDVVINASRISNAMCSCATIQRCYIEAHAYAATRLAFGRPIIAIPVVARTVALLRAEAYAARASTFFLAHLSDVLTIERDVDKHPVPKAREVRRMLLNLNKYWTALRATQCCPMAIEVFGGNGAIEEFSVLPRLLRDSIVAEQWEGPHNVLCSQVLRDAQRLSLHVPFFDFLSSLASEASHDVQARVQRSRERFDKLLRRRDGDVYVRDVLDELRPLTQALLLLREGGRYDPLVPVCAEHMLAVTAPGYDPLNDSSLMQRVAQLLSNAPAAKL
eukprot:Sspe_Gene.68602::Locus_40448_Transcript_2_3_Confidence_0.667_Length_1820::g.68602::m.68602